MKQTRRAAVSTVSTSTESSADLLGRLFGELFGLVVGGRPARHQRRLELLRDRLLRDRALDDIVPRRQLEHHIQERRLRDLPERVLGEDELDVVVAEEALVLLDERVLGLGEDLDEVLTLELVH